MSGRANCVFCRIADGKEPTEIVEAWPEAVAFEPLNPVVPGHLLVIPKKHIIDLGDSYRLDPLGMLDMMRLAGHLATKYKACNVITSKGRAATQSVFHLHLHVVPRTDNDGLALPWYSGKSPSVGVDA